MHAHERIIVALDVPDRERSLNLAKRLKGEVGMVKVGLESFVGHGPDFVRQLNDLGLPVFLDLKLHDIPRTAAAAAKQTAALNVKLLTIHASGGAEMVSAVREAAAPETQVIAVTMLTSFDQASANAVGYHGDINSIALKMARAARGAGADGLVCSTHELATLQELGGTRVVPGVRQNATVAHDDQRRTATPFDAVKAGATWIVVGRPVLQAEDPVAAVHAIAQEIELTQ